MNKKIDEDLEFIKKFSKISVQEICNKKNVNRANLLNGRTLRLTQKELEKELNQRLLSYI